MRQIDQESELGRTKVKLCFNLKIRKIIENNNYGENRLLLYQKQNMYILVIN